LVSTFEVTEDMLKEANVGRLEHVTVTMNVEHGRRGDLSVDLISPNQITSHLSATRRLDSSTAGYSDWTFMSVVHWGESGAGTWTVIIKDTQVNEHNGTFIDWHLKLWGESEDASKAKLLPMPDEHDDDNHDVIATTTVGASTTSVTPVDTPTSIPTNPTDHPDRPVNSKPTGTTDEEVSETTTAAPTESTPAAPTNSSWLPSFFPTFGVSPHTQAWIYGSFALIVTFCIGLGIYFYLARRRRLRNNLHDDYEFEMIQDEEAEGLTQNGNGHMGGKKPKRRAGELYDAFATGSEEDEPFSDAEEDVAATYRDTHVIGDDEDDEDEDEDEHTGDGDEKQKLQS